MRLWFRQESNLRAPGFSRKLFRLSYRTRVAVAPVVGHGLCTPKRRAGAELAGVEPAAVGFGGRGVTTDSALNDPAVWPARWATRD